MTRLSVCVNWSHPMSTGGDQTTPAHKVSPRLSRGHGSGDAEHGPLGHETHTFLEVLHPSTPRITVGGRGVDLDRFVDHLNLSSSDISTLVTQTTFPLAMAAGCVQKRPLVSYHGQEQRREFSTSHSPRTNDRKRCQAGRQLRQ